MKKARFMLLIALLVAGCDSYPLEDAKKNGDIITGPPGQINEDKLDAFLHDVAVRKDSKIRITSYTIEGDPVLHDLHYADGMIHYTYDNSRDKHGGKRKGKYSTACKKIGTMKLIETENDDQVDYALSECKKIIGIHDPEKKAIYLMSKLK